MKLLSGFFSFETELLVFEFPARLSSVSHKENAPGDKLTDNEEFPSAALQIPPVPLCVLGILNGTSVISVRFR